MGQQQILLLVVAAIVVVVAITIGIQMFTANAQSSNRDSIVSELNNLSTLAIQFYKKSSTYGGGNYSFISWTIPQNLQTTSNGTYSLISTDQTATITALGREVGDDGSTFIEMIAVITPTGIGINIVN
ncbi:MAG: hypothetical protein OEM46_07035 [Ignavibacteria bacterium]|nr:hypothetical protein [Ignavibacteria bacterium]